MGNQLPCNMFLSRDCGNTTTLSYCHYNTFFLHFGQLASKPALQFIKAFRPMRRDVNMYALSVLNTSANIKALPTNAMAPVVCEFQQA